MLTPKLIGDSDVKDRSWFECPYCYDLFLADPYQVRVGAYKSCGCRKQKAVSRTPDERILWAWLRRELARVQHEKYPPLLLKLIKPRKVSYRWNPDVSIDACENFLEDTSPRPPNAKPGWKDPLGPISPENFQWISKHASKSSRTSPASDTT